MTAPLPRYLYPHINKATLKIKFVSDIFMPNKYNNIVPIAEIPPAEILYGTKKTFMETASSIQPVVKITKSVNFFGLSYYQNPNSFKSSNIAL